MADALRRHLGPALTPSPFALWWWVVVSSAVTLCVVVFQRGALQEAAAAGIDFWVLLTFVVLGELRPVVHSGRTDPNGVNLATAFVFATLLFWGIELAVVAVLVSTAAGELARRKAGYRLLFNVAQYLVSYLAAWTMLRLLGWDPSVAAPASMTPAALLPFAAAAVTYHLANIAVVGTAIGCSDGSRQTVREAILDDFGYYAWTTGAVLALSPLVVVVLEVHWGLLPLLLLPLQLLWQTAAMSVERETRALHDDLTGLGNRTLLLQRLTDHVDAGQPVAVCLLDLDRFKEVNDTFGHGTGDQLLELVADRLRAAVRPEDTVARLGGDEFVLLLEVGTYDDATTIVDRLVAQLHQPYEVAGARIEVGASAGIAMFPEHGDDLEVLLRRADAAMYAAKEASSSTVLFTDDLEHGAPSRLELLADLRRGIRAGELVVHYQPQVRIEDGAVVRFEALVRWAHPTQGLLPPAHFLPSVERTNVMRAVTSEVLEQVLSQLARWGPQAPPVAINITLHDLADGRFADLILEELDRHGVSPSRLALELTEQALVGDPDRIGATLQALHDAGLELSIDDFGVGYASLTRLRRLPVSEVKIDRSFVDRFEARPEDRAIVTAIVDLARGLGLRCVAEGVETTSTLDALRRLGCDVAQGYLIARAMPADEVLPWCAERREGAAQELPAGQLVTADVGHGITAGLAADDG